MMKSCLIYRGRRVYKAVNLDRIENDRILKERYKDCLWQAKNYRKTVRKNEKLKIKAQKQTQKKRKNTKHKDDKYRKKQR